jgi:hypothetical protein
LVPDTFYVVDRAGDGGPGHREGMFWVAADRGRACDVMVTEPQQLVRDVEFSRAAEVSLCGLFVSNARDPGDGRQAVGSVGKLLVGELFDDFGLFTEEALHAILHARARRIQIPLECDGGRRTGSQPAFTWTQRRA